MNSTGSNLTCDFAEYALGDVKHRGQVERVSEFTLNGTRTDCYRSLFRFDEGLKTYVDRTGSVSGYGGIHTADAMLFDFDGEDLEAVREEVQKFIPYLGVSLEVPIEYVRISFSGNKGFHVAIPAPAFGGFQSSPEFWKVYKAIASDLASGFRFVDLTIYEIRRLFRMLNTINSKSGLYKISLTFDELQRLSSDQIRGLAKEPRKVETLPASEMMPVPALVELNAKWRGYDFTRETRAAARASSANDFTTILQGVTSPGRTDAATKIIGFFMSKGIDESFTLQFLKTWNQANTPPLPAEKLETTVADMFKRYKTRTTEAVKVYSVKEAEEAYREHVKNLEKSRVKTGFPSVDAKTRGVMRGEVLLILGKTSVGKSALEKNIEHNVAKASGEPILSFSLEMPLTSVFERTVQIETGFSGSDIESYYRSGSQEFFSSVDLALSSIPNIFTVTQTGLDLEAVKAVVRRAEAEVYHRKTGLVLIDYLGLIHGKGEDIYQVVSRIARGLKDLAKQLDVPVIVLSQITKKYGDHDELEIGAARDSGSIDEAADFVLGLWKDEQQDRKDSINLKLGILKNRRGGTGVVPLVMSRTSLRITEAPEEASR